MNCYTKTFPWFEGAAVGLLPPARQRGPAGTRDRGRLRSDDSAGRDEVRHPAPAAWRSATDSEYVDGPRGHEHRDSEGNERHDPKRSARHEVDRGQGAAQAARFARVTRVPAPKFVDTNMLNSNSPSAPRATPGTPRSSMSSSESSRVCDLPRAQRPDPSA